MGREKYRRMIVRWRKHSSFIQFFVAVDDLCTFLLSEPQAIRFVLATIHLSSVFSSSSCIPLALEIDP